MIPLIADNTIKTTVSKLNKRVKFETHQFSLIRVISNFFLLFYFSFSDYIGIFPSYSDNFIKQKIYKSLFIINIKA